MVPQTRTFVHLPIMAPIMTPSIMGYKSATRSEQYVERVTYIKFMWSWDINPPPPLNNMLNRLSTLSTIRWIGYLHQLDFVMGYQSATRSKQFVECVIYINKVPGGETTGLQRTCFIFQQQQLPCSPQLPGLRLFDCKPLQLHATARRAAALTGASHWCPS